jgi:hypothetical protein
MKMPIIAATDCNTDIGMYQKKKNECGLQLVSGSNKMLHYINTIIEDESSLRRCRRKGMGIQNEYIVARSYNAIIDKLHV